MGFKTQAICFISFIIILSVVMAQILNVINIDELKPSTYSARKLKSKFSSKTIQKLSSYTSLDDSTDNLIWFLQISDIHISKFQDLSRITELKQFCDKTLDVIKPAVVLASGDLTDARTPDRLGSKQYVEEWDYYKTVLDQCKVQEKTLWLDVRGNHDNFNVPGLHSPYNFYRNYSIQGKENLRSFMVTINQGSDSYSFIAVDATLDPGPKRPFNFVGVIEQEEFEQLKKFEEKAYKEANHTIWFGHYPTSSILSPYSGLRNLISKSGLVYLCGHFHQLLGLVPNMYTLQKQGYLELELADWKDERMYRLAAIDHGIFSFIDVHHNEWPVILILNPKHALFFMKSREPLSLIKNSTHIRILVFSISPIGRVTVKIDTDEWLYCENIEGPLYTVKWDSNKYAKGLHKILVVAEDTHGRTRTIEQPFSLDNSKLYFNILPRIALMMDVTFMCKFVFWMMLFICLVPLVMFRILHHLVKIGRIQKPRRYKSCFYALIRKLWILSTVNRLYYPIILYTLYLPFGPWAIGEVIDGHTGVIFAWGTVIKGAFLPGSITYLYGFVQLLLFHFPLIIFLAHVTDLRLRNLYCEERCSLAKRVWRYCPFFILLTVQIIFAFIFLMAYGKTVFILGPFRTWSIVLAIVLWRFAVNLPDYSLREASFVWKKSAKSKEEIKLYSSHS